MFHVSLLNFVLARRCPNLVSMSCVAFFTIHNDLARRCPNLVSMSCVALPFTMILGAEVVNFGPQNVSFGMLAASTLAPWGIIERSVALRTHEGRPWGPGLDRVDFEWISAFESF